jgi:hypothetical protein
VPSSPTATAPETVSEPRAHELTERDTDGHTTDGKKFPYDSGTMSAHLLIRKTCWACPSTSPSARDAHEAFPRRKGRPALLAYGVSAPSDGLGRCSLTRPCNLHAATAPATTGATMFAKPKSRRRSVTATTTTTLSATITASLPATSATRLSAAYDASPRATTDV